MSATIIGDCARCESPLEKGDLRCAICGCSVPRRDEPSAATAIEKTTARILRCEGCGAAVSYDVEVRAPHCRFCGAVQKVETVEDPMEQTELFLPFTVEPGEADEALRTYFRSLGFFRPSDLATAARIDTRKRLWWVGWTFDADALISWAADSDAGAGRSAWAPHSGQVRMTFDDLLVPATRGLDDDEADYLARSYELGTAAAELPAEQREGAIVEQFDVQRSLARRRILSAISATAAARVASRHVPGSSTRNVHVEPLLRGLTTRRFAFPAYVVAYRYRDTLYRAIVSGQDARYVTGSAPYSWAKILITIFAVAAIVALAAAMAIGVIAAAG